MQVSSVFNNPYVPATGRTREASAAAAPSKTVVAEDSLTSSDRQFLMGSLGVSVKTDGNGGVEYGMPDGLTEDERIQRSWVAAQMAVDRKAGNLTGDVSSSYFQGLLGRMQTSGDQSPPGAVIDEALKYLADGGRMKHVDTRV